MTLAKLKEIRRIASDGQATPSQLRSGLLDVLNDYESIQRKANMALRHKELSLQIAGARRKQARDLAERLGAFVVPCRQLLHRYDQNEIDYHYATDDADHLAMDKAFEALRELLGELRLADEREAHDEQR